MSKEMPIEVFAKKVGINKKEQDWIVKNDKDTHYVNNSALKNSWISLSYPIYDGDYYFAFIHKKARVNAQYNAKANRELRNYIKSTLSADEIFDKMEKYFSMQFKDAGSGDTMTREELWSAIVDMRRKNPVKEEVEESKKMTSAQKREFDKLYKKMDGGKEHQAIKQKIKNPVKADDAFHSLVMKKVLGEGKGTDIFKKYGSIINRLSDKEKDEVIELLYQMNSQSGKQYKQAFSKVKELLNMEYIPEETISESAEMVIHTDNAVQSTLIVKMAGKHGLKSKKTKISWSGKDGVVVSGDSNKMKKFMSAVEKMSEETIPEETDLQEVALDTNMLQRQFPNVWATKDTKLYRVLFSLISFHGYNDNKKSYDKDKKKFVDALRGIAKNPKKYEKTYGRNFAQFIEKPKKGQAFAEEKVDLMSQGWANAFGKTTQLDEEVANITVDPKNRINSGQQQAYHGMEIAKQARRMGLKSAVMHKHVRIKGAKKAVNDFLRVVIGKSRYGDPTEKDMSTPQVDKMLTKGLK